jgi:tetratricopeptide (TPR) repeat protein
LEQLTVMNNLIYTLPTRFKGHFGRTFATLAVLLSAFSLQAYSPVYPLSENSWNNPEFVKRFLGTYGVNTRVEPEITREESELFTELAPLFSDDPLLAIQQLQAAITPESSAALDYTLASLNLQQGNHAVAIRQYRNAIRKFPNFMRAYKNLGLAHLQIGEFAESIPLIVKAIELGDGDGNSYGLLGYAYLNTNRPQSALDAYRIATVLVPDNRDWRIGKAHSMSMVGNYREAAALLAELIEETPNQRSFWLSRANAFISMGEEKEAATQLEMLKRLALADAVSLRLLGDIYMNQGMPGLALPNYIAAIDRSDRLPLGTAVTIAETLSRFGALAEAKDYIAAIENQYGDAIEDSVESRLLNLRAEIALAENQDAEAAEILEEVVRLDPVNGRALLLLADYHHRAGEFEEATFYYERVQNMPDFRVEALVQHARMRVAQRDYAKAVSLLSEAQRLQPRQAVENYLEAVRGALEATR